MQQATVSPETYGVEYRLNRAAAYLHNAERAHAAGGDAGPMIEAARYEVGLALSKAEGEGDYADLHESMKQVALHVGEYLAPGSDLEDEMDGPGGGMDVRYLKDSSDNVLEIHVLVSTGGTRIWVELSEDNVTVRGESRDGRKHYLPAGGHAYLFDYFAQGA